MVSSNRPGREKASRHAAQAREYRRLAVWLREQENAPEAAGELLYAAAKQGINAAANQRGLNPGSTAAKRQFLRDIDAQNSGTPPLSRDWYTLAKLHTHADQIHLPASEFAEAWEKAQAFIDQMLAIYGGGG